MNWISQLENPGHITEAVNHFNRARDKLEHKASKIDVSRLLFEALNKIQTEWQTKQVDKGLGEVKAFKAVILETLGVKARLDFLQSKELKDIVYFEPQIMNHDTLTKHGYRPGVEIGQTLKKKATEEHRRLLNAYKTFFSPQEGKNEEPGLKRAAELLYVVRSNIAHGEKTPNGPDLKKKERDEKVSTITIPLQLLLLNMMFDCADQKLIAYGTLAPGRPNHYILSDLQGHWEKCIIKGVIDEVNGLSTFTWDLGGSEIEAELFVSANLPERWSGIDKFEGSSYKRRLITAITNSRISVAYIYLSAHH